MRRVAYLIHLTHLTVHVEFLSVANCHRNGGHPADAVAPDASQRAVARESRAASGQRGLPACAYHTHRPPPYRREAAPARMARANIFFTESINLDSP